MKQVIINISTFDLLYFKFSIIKLSSSLYFQTFIIQFFRHNKVFILFSYISKMGNKKSQTSPATQNEDIYSPQILIGTQKLFEVNALDMNRRQHKNVVSIIWRKKFQVGRGSGLLISENLVLTCGHNLFHNTEQIPANIIEIYVGHHGVLEKYYKVEKYFVSEGFISSPVEGNTIQDYALLKLTQKCFSNEFIALSDQPRITSEDRTYAVFGYPAQKYISTNIEGKQKTSQWGIKKKNAIVEVRKSMSQIIHCISTLPGQSGSPILQFDQLKNQVTVIGIHTGGITTKLNGKLQKMNTGVLFTENTIDVLQKAAQELNAEPFTAFRKKDSKNKAIITTLSNNQANKQNGGETTGKKDEDQAQLYFKLAFAHHTSGNVQQAIKIYLKVIELDPLHQSAFKYLGAALQKIDMFQQSIMAYQKAILLKPDDYQAYFNMGIALQRMNRVEQAIQKYNKALELNPKYTDAYNNLAGAYQQSGRSDQAVSLYEKLIKIEPQQAEAYYNLGVTLHKIGRKEEAILRYRKALELKPVYPSAFNNLGAALEQTGKFQQAIFWYQKSLALTPHQYKAYYNLAITLQRLQRNSQAIKYYKKAIEINPDYADAYNNLGAIYLRDEKVKEAVVYLRHSIRCNRNQQNAYNNLGLALHYLKQFQEAMDCFKKAIELNPYYVNAYQNLGNLYQEMNQQNLAISCYQNVLRIKVQSSGK